MKVRNLPGMTISAEDALRQEERDLEMQDYAMLDQDMLEQEQEVPMSIEDEMASELGSLQTRIGADMAQNSNMQESPLIDAANDEVTNPYTQPAGPTLQDKLQMLKEARDSGRMTSGIMRGAGRISDAIARGYGGSTGFDNTYGQDIAKNAEKDLAEYIKEQKDQAKLDAAERKSKLEQLYKVQEFMRKKSKDEADIQLKRDKFEKDLQSEKEMQDPNSEISKAYRESAKGMGINVSDSTSAQMLDKSMGGLLRMESQKLYLQGQKELQKDREEKRKIEQEMKQNREDRLTNQNQVNTARGLLKDDPRYNKVMEQSMEFDQVGDIISQVEKGNEAALAALGTKLARAMGEVGVLTDTDVVRYVGSTSWGRKLKDWFTKGAKGNLPKETLNDLRANIGTIQNKLAENKTKIFTRAGDRMQTAFPDMERSRIDALLGYTPMKQKVKVQLPDGKTGSIDADKVEAFKKKYPNAKVMD